jgi:hypothetical protein
MLYAVDLSQPKLGKAIPNRVRHWALDYAFVEESEGCPHQAISIFRSNEMSDAISRNPQPPICRWASFKVAEGREAAISVAEKRADVVIDDSDWERHETAIVHALAQAWRFLQIDETLGSLEEALRDGHRTPTRQHQRMLSKLLLNLPRYEKPLTDPLGVFATREQAQIYRKIARALGLPGWRNHIDERVEVVEALLGSAIERRTSTAHLILEMLIIVAILADILLHAYLAFSGRE